MRPSPFQAFVRIMMGCDKFCTYCIVPSVRGPEQSRPPAASWPRRGSSPTRASRKSPCWARPSTATSSARPTAGPAASPTCSQRLHDIDGIERIKFITNFPNDMTDDLLQAVRDLPGSRRYLHVPAQSGCDEVLKRMKRMYTVASYEDMLARIRETVPDVAVSSDFIVGFCGETEASFERTVRLVERARFKNSFIFKYSARQGTKADTLYRRRRARGRSRSGGTTSCWRVQTAISLEDNRRLDRPDASRSWSKGRAGRRPGGTAGMAVGQLDGSDGLRPDRGLRWARAADRPVRAGAWSRMPARVTLFGRVETTERCRARSGVKGRVDGGPARRSGEVLGRLGAGSTPAWLADRGRAGVGVRGRPAILPARGRSAQSIAGWEQRHGYRAARGLRAWLRALQRLLSRTGR